MATKTITETVNENPILSGAVTVIMVILAFPLIALGARIVLDVIAKAGAIALGFGA